MPLIVECKHSSRWRLKVSLESMDLSISSLSLSDREEEDDAVDDDDDDEEEEGRRSFSDSDCTTSPMSSRADEL